MGPPAKRLSVVKADRRFESCPPRLTRRPALAAGRFDSAMPSGRLSRHHELAIIAPAHATTFSLSPEGGTVNQPRTLLRGPDVCLSAISEEDLPVIAGWHQDTGFLRLHDAHSAAPRTPAQIREDVERMQKSGSDFIFGLRRVEGDMLIGLVEIDGILWAHRAGGLGIAIGRPEHRGHGYGAQACSLALDFAFDELNLRRIRDRRHPRPGRRRPCCSRRLPPPRATRCYRPGIAARRWRRRPAPGRGRPSGSGPAAPA